MNRKIRLLLIIFIFVSCSDTGNFDPEQERTDPAFKIFNEAKAASDVDEKLRLLSKAAKKIKSSGDTLLNDIIDHQIYYHDVEKNYDSSFFYANLMINHAKKIEDTAGIAKGYYRRGRSNLYQQKHLNVLNDMFMSKKYYLMAGDSINAGKRLVELGIAQHRLGDFSESQNSLTQALRLLEKSGDSTFLASLYNNLAINYRQLNDLDEAIEEYDNSLRFVSSIQDSLIVLNNIANIYREKENFTKSLQIFKSILPLATDSTLINRIKDNYFFTQWWDGNINTEDSLKVIYKSRQEKNDLPGLLSSQDHLIMVNLEKDPEEALFFAEKYYATAKNLNSVTDAIKALGFLLRLSPPEENRKYSLEYMRLNDSLMTARDGVKNLFAKIKYDEEQKLEKIDELEQLSSIQNLELLQERNRRNLAILFGLLILVAAFFVYYYLRQRHKRATVRKIHETEARISKKIHDELANDVFNVMTELENPQTINKEVTMNKLESIYERTRNISRENNAISTGPEYKEDLQYMISGNTPAHVKTYLIGFDDIIWENYKEETRIVIFRVLQELMVNMKKHSNASIVSLNFSQNTSNLQVSYNDNGVGISQNGFKKGSGLHNVETRIASLGGSLKLQPNNQGFSVQIQIPV